MKRSKDTVLPADDPVKRARARKLRIVWLGVAAGSYALDALFLGLFAATGIIAPLIPFAYGAGAAVFCALFYAAIESGWSLRFRDPSLTTEQIIIGTAMQLGVVAVAPQIAFPYLANLFTVFAFGVLQLTVRQFVLVWVLGVTGTGFVLFAVADRISFPAEAPFALLLAWLYFASILGRSVLLSIYAQGLRARLADSRRKLAASLEHIQELVGHDELTKAFNRRYLIEQLDQEKARSERSGIPFSVAILDLDHFKSINDTLGHLAGDEVLKAFTNLVEENMREIDTFGRYGGEEFLIILTATPQEHAVPAIERMRAAAVAKDWTGIAPGQRVTFSAGIAVFRQGDTIEQLLHRADAALYQAKRKGRNLVIGDFPAAPESPQAAP
jgi:diguanylate cyclase (GGDEF)-like protein